VSALELQGVVKEYAGPSETIRAVDSVSLAVAAGEMVALYGPSGSGKSTLLMLAAGLLVPDSGAVRFLGRDVGSMSADEASDYQRREVGFIYQSAHLMAGVPAVENAAIKLLADRVSLHDARQAAIPWLERVGLAQRLAHTPEQLSGGERQRVAIARALVNGPQLILADEPTGNLDSASAGEVLEVLARVNEQGATIVVVTHSTDVAQFASRILGVADGLLVTDEPADRAPAIPVPG
jgi:putative ABC transport system ATP-binding protein